VRGAGNSAYRRYRPTHWFVDAECSSERNKGATNLSQRSFDHREWGVCGRGQSKRRMAMTAYIFALAAPRTPRTLTRGDSLGVYGRRVTTIDAGATARFGTAFAPAQPANYSRGFARRPPQLVVLFCFLGLDQATDNSIIRMNRTAQQPRKRQGEHRRGAPLLLMQLPRCRRKVGRAYLRGPQSRSSATEKSPVWLTTAQAVRINRSTP
jgi:hypothetical protein